MKTCLIMVIGLTRTYQKTFPYLIKNIIQSNKDEYKFDIISHTSENDDNVHRIHSQLCSNYYPMTKDVRLNDGGSSNIMYVRILECYQHVHNTLQKPVYDLYMYVRFDLCIHFPIRLSRVNDNLVCLLDHRCDGPNRIFGDVHDRDWDFSFIGKHEVFECMIKALKEYFEKKSESTYSICDKIKNSPVNPKWTPETAPAFICKYYNGKHGSRTIMNNSYTSNNTGCQEFIFVKLNKIGKYLDFKWGGHNCFVGHLVR